MSIDTTTTVMADCGDGELKVWDDSVMEAEYNLFQ